LSDVEIESPSIQEEILETQEVQDSLTFEIPRRSKQERKQPDWFSYWSMAEFAYSAIIDTPLTFDEAIESSDKKKWQISMDEEIDAHRRNKTWKLVPRPVEKSVIDNKWIFRIKTDAAGNPIRFKSRLVVRGFRQYKGMDYNDTFSPVARYDSARLIFAIAAAKNLKIRQFDVSTAFLSGDIDETIYMEQPEGYVAKEHPEYVCKLQRAIYGLKQAPIQFNKKMYGTLKNIGLMPIYSDRCVFIGQVGDNTVFMALYVDDAILAPSSLRARIGN